MEALIYRAAIVVAALFAMGANYRTQNFVVTTQSAEFAKQVGDAAEEFRRDLAILWIGKELPRWAQPCPITVQVGPNLGAGGATSFVFDRGEVFGWTMNIQGTPERVIDSVLPHEVTHTIFASYFRRPLPRWADEGACTTVEHEGERRKQQQMLVEFLKTGRGIPFSKMFMMRDYPADVMPLYSQGFSLCRYLIQQGGRKKFVDFISEGMRGDQWTAVTKKYYGYANLGELQNSWVDWVRNGSPALDMPDDVLGQDSIQLASNDQKQRPSPNLIYRAQSEDPAPAPLVSASRAANEWKNASAPERALNAVSQNQSAAVRATSTTLSYPRDGQMKAQVVQPAAESRSSQAAEIPAESRQVLLEWSQQGPADEQGRPLPPPPRQQPSPSHSGVTNPFATAR